MTNGSLTSRCRDEVAQARAEAGLLRELLVGGMDMPRTTA